MYVAWLLMSVVILLTGLSYGPRGKGIKSRFSFWYSCQFYSVLVMVGEVQRLAALVFEIHVLFIGSKL